MFKLGYGDKRPVYEQIKEKLKELIISGAIKTDEKIPSVRELALTLAINPNTIQKAYKELENEGYIYSLKAKGYFVSNIETNLFGEKIKTILSGLEKQLGELYFLGVPKAKISKIVERVYDGGNGNDKS